jgi:hypothetical protein
MVSLTTVMFLIFAYMHIWVWGIYWRWFTIAESWWNTGLLNIIAAIWRPSPLSATWGCAMPWWRWTHLTWTRIKYLRKQKKIYKYSKGTKLKKVVKRNLVFLHCFKWDVLIHRQTHTHTHTFCVHFVTIIGETILYVVMFSCSFLHQLIVAIRSPWPSYCLLYHSLGNCCY